jgi:hypothetical protein
MGENALAAGKRFIADLPAAVSASRPAPYSGERAGRFVFFHKQVIDWILKRQKGKEEIRK